MLNNFKTLALLCGFVVASGAVAWSAQEVIDLEDARKQTLNDTFRLLDKVESDFPRAQADLVKIRERISILYKNPVVLAGGYTEGDVPGLMLSRQNSSSKIRNRKLKRSEFYDSLNGLHDEELILKLRTAIQNQKVLDYGEARRFIMLNVENFDSHIECLYTGRVISATSMPNSTNMNIEHSWPQSKGATGPAKSDMHHLFPTDSVANSTRSSLPFGIVENPKWAEGGSKCDGKRFDVRPQSRGNIARAIFYFSTRYAKRIAPSEEEVLRKWHQEDPVDAHEKSRNERVEAIQGNRNPFIDKPEFVNNISDF